MKREIVHIEEALCNGCGLCASACQEGAIQMTDGKARLVRDDYCDGLGHCLPSCPTGAISIIVREAEAFDEEAVKQNQAQQEAAPLACGCPGSESRSLRGEGAVSAATTDCCAGRASADSAAHADTAVYTSHPASQLRQWPVQIQLAPVNAPYFQDAHLLVAADCAAYAYGAFHQRFMKNRVTLIGCPKLDHADYAQKLTEILRHNPIKSLTIVRMQVPCCGGLERAAVQALQDSGKFIPWQVHTLTTDGQILED